MDDYIDDGVELVSERNVYERVAVQRPDMFKNPFLYNVYAVFDSLRDKLSLSDSDMHLLEKYAQVVDFPSSKNAAMFVLAYKCIKDRKDRDASYIKSIAKHMPKLSLALDIQRYIYLINHISK